MIEKLLHRMLKYSILLEAFCSPLLLYHFGIFPLGNPCKFVETVQPFQLGKATLQSCLEHIGQ